MARIWSRGRSFVICALAFTLVAPLFAADRLEFISVDPNDEYTRADDKLCELLENATKQKLDRNPQGTYVNAIRSVLGRSEKHQPYLARLTPYALVAAEMLGAKLELLATYNSRATENTTYSSYFIVNRKNFSQFDSKSPPQLTDLLQYLRRGPRKTFIYHDKFSTSSYFLPSLYFRSQRIFAMPASIRGLTAIDIQPLLNKGSSDLVAQVADEKADVAAVWDGTLRELQPQILERIYGIQLPTKLPNDLLVSSEWTSTTVRGRIKAALQNTGEPITINIGDFRFWTDIEDAPSAREALALLRRQATAPPAPTTVRISWAPDQSIPDAKLQKYLEAARQAVRLSGTEFVVYDDDFHKRADVMWDLRLIHDGSISLTCEYEQGAGIDPQVFTISFTEAEEDLTTRIVGLIHSQMHRIRYIWPYQEQDPTVIRDVDFSFSEGDRLKVLRAIWNDPDRNDFSEDGFFDAEVAHADFYKFQLKSTGFPKLSDGIKYDFDPMSNVAYRVFLVRSAKEGFLFRALTVVLLILLAGAGLGAAWDLSRSTKPEPTKSDTRPGSVDSFDRACDEIVAAKHSPWQTQPVIDAEVYACNREEVEHLINELKTNGLIPPFAIIKRRTWSHAIKAKLGLPGDVAEFGAGFSWARELHVDPAEVGNAARLANLIPFLIANRQLSPFVGKPTEWDALNMVASQLFMSDAARNPVEGSGLIVPTDPLVRDLAGRHFARVIKETTQKVSLFNQDWQVETCQTGFLLRRIEEFPTAISLDSSAQFVRGLVMECTVRPSTDPKIESGQTSLAASVLGKVVRRNWLQKDSGTYLFLEFAPMAILVR